MIHFFLLLVEVAKVVVNDCSMVLACSSSSFSFTDSSCVSSFEVVELESSPSTHCCLALVMAAQLMISAWCMLGPCGQVNHRPNNDDGRLSSRRSGGKICFFCIQALVSRICIWASHPRPFLFCLLGISPVLLYLICLYSFHLLSFYSW